MKEFDENMAAELMLAALSPERRSLFSTDNAIEVIDLIFDYYEDAGLTDLDFDDEDDYDLQAERRDAVAYVLKVLAKDREAPAFTSEEIAAMVAAEMDYEESLI